MMNFFFQKPLQKRSIHDIFLDIRSILAALIEILVRGFRDQLGLRLCFCRGGHCDSRGDGLRRRAGAFGHDLQLAELTGGKLHLALPFADIAVLDLDDVSDIHGTDLLVPQAECYRARVILHLRVADLPLTIELAEGPWLALFDDRDRDVYLSLLWLEFLDLHVLTPKSVYQGRMVGAL